MKTFENADVPSLVEEQKRVIEEWHAKEPSIRGWDDACRLIGAGPLPSLRGYAASIARINTFQWHEEDKARDPGASDSVIAAVKRTIDASNQRRVDEIERLDLLIHEGLKAAGTQGRAASYSSETPGSLVDRISILLLKLYHTRERMEAVDGAAREKFAARLRTQEEQLADLTAFLRDLFAGLRDGTRGFKLYFQFKMYNDPETNPYMRRR